MYKISELIGKQSITLLDADSRGVICNAFFDKTLTRCKSFLLLSDDDENRYYVDYKSLSSVSGDAVVIKSAEGITEQPQQGIIASPINLPAFNQDGKALGVIRDINMEGAAVISFVTDSGEIPAGTLLSRSDSIIVFNDTGKPVKVKRPQRAKNDKADTEKADFSERNGLDNGMETAAEETKPARVETPLKVTLSMSSPVINAALSKYYFLLGKRLQRSIYSNQGGLIARENDLITEDIIQSAKENGKLVAIALHSL